MKEIEIPYNSETLAATLFDDNSNDNETVLIIASATGVKQEYYRNFAKYVENNGNVLRGSLTNRSNRYL